MNLSYEKNPVTLDRVYTLVISDFEMPNMRRYDSLLMDECSRPDATIADKLLGLQMVAFRIEQERASSLPAEPEREG